MTIKFSLMKINPFLLAIVSYPSILHSAIVSSNDESVFTEKLYERCPILKTTLRPVFNYSELVPIRVLFRAIRFHKIDDKEQTFHLIGILIAVWDLPSCGRWIHDPTWKHIWRIRPSDFNNEQSAPFWYPVIWQPNSHENVFSVLDFARENNFVTSYFDQRGWGGYDAAGRFTADCDLAANISNFPFDTVTCSLNFQSWFPTILVNITNDGFLPDRNLPDEPIIPAGFMQGSSVWSLLEVGFSQSIVHQGRHQYTEFTYFFHFKRKPATYFLTVFAPAIALFILLLASFAIDPKFVERAEYSLAVVINVFLLQGVVNNKLPDSDEPTAAAWYISSLLIFGTLSTVYFAVMPKVCQHWENWKISAMNHQFLVTNIIEIVAFSISLLSVFIINVVFFNQMIQGFIWSDNTPQFRNI